MCGQSCCVDLTLGKDDRKANRGGQTGGRTVRKNAPADGGTDGKEHREQWSHVQQRCGDVWSLCDIN